MDYKLKPVREEDIPQVKIIKKSPFESDKRKTRFMKVYPNANDEPIEDSIIVQEDPDLDKTPDYIRLPSASLQEEYK